MRPCIIDVSSNNGTIDFVKVFAAMDAAKDGKKRVFIRTSLGFGDKDKNCMTYASAAAAAGLTVSYYHFAYPSKKAGSTPADDAKSEANYFCDTVAAMPKYEKLVVDCEPFGQGKDTLLSKDEYAQWLQTFLDTVKQRTGIDCIVYTYADYLNQHLPANHTFGKYPMWIANYGNINKPPISKGWTAYYMWQFNEKGKIDGISTNVDFSIFNSTLGL